MAYGGSCCRMVRFTLSVVYKRGGEQAVHNSLHAAGDFTGRRECGACCRVYANPIFTTDSAVLGDLCIKHSKMIDVGCIGDMEYSQPSAQQANLTEVEPRKCGEPLFDYILGK